MSIRFLKTNRIVKFTVCLIFLLASLPIKSSSQDLYDLGHSKKYAEYLFSSHQYKLAAEEYERLIFFDHNNVSFRYRLVKSYRLAGDLNSGINRMYTLYPDSIYLMPEVLATEFVRLELLSDSLPSASRFLVNEKNLTLENKTVFQSCILILNGKYNEAGILENQAVSANLKLPSNLLMLTGKAETIRFKKPFIAAGFSAIIPGTGKFYTKNWSDGIFSFLFVATNAWQAYRGFSRDGVRSGYGWVFSGLSASFYVGNIFGSVKAVKRYNILKKNEIDNQIYDFVRSDSF